MGFILTNNNKKVIVCFVLFSTLSVGGDTMYVFVNGYGAPLNPLEDDNFDQYLGNILKQLKEHCTYQCINLYLAGGYTNRTDMSEAEAMHEWFAKHQLPVHTVIHLISKTDTARENMREFQKVVGSDTPVFVFCELSRKPTMEFFAKKFFKHYMVYGVKFDAASLTLTNCLKQYTIKLWLEQLAWHSKTVDNLRKWLRKRQVTRSRAAMH